MKSKIYINTIPKSGTHLLAKVLENNGFSHRVKKFIAADWVISKSKLKRIIKIMLWGGHSGNLVNIGLDVHANVSENALKKLLISNELLEGNTFIMGHAPYSDLLFNLLTTNGTKTIIIIRDPRDVLVSWAKSVSQENQHFADDRYLNSNFEKCLKSILLGGRLDNGLFIESFASILRNSLGWLTAPGVLVVRFEDLVGASGGGDDSLQKATISKILDFTGMDNLRESSNNNKLFGNSKTFRSGQIESWRSEISLPLKNLIDEKISHLLPLYGYS